MKNRVLSFDSDAVDYLQNNHQAYADFIESPIEFVSTAKIDIDKQKVLFQFHKIYSILNAMQEGDCLLVLDKYTVLYNFYYIEKIIGNRDYLVFNQNPESKMPMLGLLVFRRTIGTLTLLSQFIMKIGQWASELNDLDKTPALVFQDVFETYPCDAYLPTGVMGAIPARWEHNSFVDSLRNALPFAVHCQPLRLSNQHLSYDDPGYDRRYLMLLIYESESLRMGRPSLLGKQAEPEFTDTSDLHINESAPVALVSLYTENIACYGQLHVDTMVSYCKRHGYGYHVHRQAPEFLPKEVKANWAKAHLIRHYLAQHEFVAWIDSDIIASNQNKNLDGILHGKDLVFGTDHTAWVINSCFVGFRRTDWVMGILDEICQQIELTESKDSVYASGGDQQVFWKVLNQHGLIRPPYWHDALSLGASPVYADPDTMLVHFPAMHDAHRAASMKVWLARLADGAVLDKRQDLTPSP